jgi:hypothetical protein
VLADGDIGVLPGPVRQDPDAGHTTEPLPIGVERVLVVAGRIEEQADSEVAAPLPAIPVEVLVVATQIGAQPQAELPNSLCVTAPAVAVAPGRVEEDPHPSQPGTLCRNVGGVRIVTAHVEKKPEGTVGGRGGHPTGVRIVAPKIDDQQRIGAVDDVGATAPNPNPTLRGLPVEGEMRDLAEIEAPQRDPRVVEGLNALLRRIPEAGLVERRGHVVDRGAIVECVDHLLAEVVAAGHDDAVTTVHVPERQLGPPVRLADVEHKLPEDRSDPLGEDLHPLGKLLLQLRVRQVHSKRVDLDRSV